MAMANWHSYCGDSIWNDEFAWNTSSPRLTLCFRRTILVWFPPIYLTLLLPILIHSWKSSEKHFKWNPYNKTRMALAIALMLDQFVELIIIIYDYVTELGSTKKLHDIEIVNAFIRVIYSMILCCLFGVMVKRGIHSSGVIWSYLGLSLLCLLVELASILFIGHRNNENMKFNPKTDVTLSINCLLTLALFIQSFISDSESFGTSASFKKKKKIMEKGEKALPKNKASFISRLTFSWFSKLTYVGWKRPIELNDVWKVRTEDSVERNYMMFQNELDEIRKKYQNKHHDMKRFRVNILRLIWGSLKGYFLTGAFFKIFQDILIFINPMILKKLINFISDEQEPNWHGYVYALGIFLVTSGQIFSLNYYFNRMMIFGIRVRTQLIAAVYRKVLKLSNGSRSKFTTGQIVNLMAVDAQRFIDISNFINLIWSAPFQIIIALWLLWQELGVSVLGGLFFMIILIPINAYLTNFSKRYQIEGMKLKDERVKVMNEVLNGAKIIKLYSWERAFIDKIQKIRSKELNALKKLNYIGAILQALWNLAPFIVSFITFGIYVSIDQDNVLTPSKAFVSLALFNILRFPLTMLPNLVIMIIMTSVSIKRLNNFLSSLELTSYIVRCEKEKLQKNDEDEQQVNCMVLDNCSFSWYNQCQDDVDQKKKKLCKSKDEEMAIKEKQQKFETDPSKPFLKKIDMKIKEKSFVAIVGNVGSGKSSLLHAILGNMELTEGTINIDKSKKIAYSSQEAWIQNNTLRDNITFGKPFDEEFYLKVVKSCCLMADFSALPGGDLTEIGEKGTNLSGGQKQRVNLARASYSDADIYLLDDPLSAVDSHVGQDIFEHLLSSQTGFLRNKTRILVTNNLSVLPFTDQIFVLKNGEIIQSGSYQTLMKQSCYFANLIQQYSTTKEANNEDGEEEDVIKNNTNKVNGKLPNDNNNNNAPTEASETAFNFKINKLIEKEEAQVGHVNFQVYAGYLKAITVGWCTAIIINYTLSQSSNAGAGLWLSHWSKSAEQHTIDHPTLYYLMIYGLIGLCQGVFQALGWLSLTKGILGAARLLHNRMLHSIFRSAMSFFDVTPLGRILNRFSKDIDVCDAIIQGNIRIFTTCLFSTLCTLIIITLELPIFLIIILPVVLCFYFIQKLYISTARQLQRIESITKSPVYSHFSETLAGVPTIRAYCASDRFISKNDQNLDINNACSIALITANRWLAIRLENIANAIVLFSAIFSVIYREKMDSAAVGLMLSFAMSTTQNLNFLVRASTDLETNLVSVERILEYTDLSSEAEWEIEEEAPPSDWPQYGRVEFVDYGTRYRPGLDLVLKGISVSIQPKEKIGIVGRTGAGKSSLTLALFRLIEPAQGSIKIDGIDISRMGLHQLRKRITIIPQDPVLFSGTLRTNLDPFDSFSDEEIWHCLELAHLKDFARGIEGQLDHEITEGGSNLSIGQRQSVCLARALLRKTKVLVLDEATAAVDMETDSLIQQTIRKSFKDCTILTIAHRLNTIMDSDRILVLNDGRVAEFDSPSNLMADKTSIFYSMVEASGVIPSM